MSAPDARLRFLDLLRSAVHDGTLVKLTLGKHRGADATLNNLFVRPVTLKSGPHLSLLWRHATRDITKNHPPAEALALIEPLLGSDFLDAHLFTPAQNAQFETRADGTARLSVKTASTAPTPVAETHDRAKAHLIAGDAPWLRDLGVTNDRGLPREGMAHKFRQIQKFTELLSQLLTESELLPSADSVSQLSTLNSQPSPAPIRIADMGCGKGYLTFALAAHLGPRAEVTGIEFRPELVQLCNDLSRTHGLALHLSFAAGDIASTVLERLDVLVALHACDTATDDALIKGITAGARLLVVSPCCQKELRAQLTAPPVLTDALRHGIFQERQAEFVTDSLRAMLLEWAGYRTKVFEFISTEHTAKNIMITAIKTGHARGADTALATRIRTFAAFYGIHRHSLATHLGFSL
ncbi:class I SAM-dependent methyltransferase [Rariglobus hedericola]|uniref:SAM-dependent methyltransferase n=1 Tax=Rariglobus hedericola TaxID=2597822 RepID=A0A556QMM0_9BACT|nr:SAM-dependent methyltransferase [Rariglobus hedericola]TSJ77867.1 SAM-dependent methyltransferase [Rariglobus hedericola]